VFPERLVPLMVPCIAQLPVREHGTSTALRFLRRSPLRPARPLPGVLLLLAHRVVGRGEG